MSNHTPGPWNYVPSTEAHGPYVTSDYGNTICDFYVMSKPSALSVANGGDSHPIPFMAEMADDNARLAAAAPEMANVIRAFINETVDYMTLNNLGDPEQQHNVKWGRAVLAKATGVDK